MNSRNVILIVIAVVLVAGGAVTAWLALGRADVHVGSKDFTEQMILMEMIAQLIEGHTDLQVERHGWLGGTMVCFNALRGGDLDCYAEYTGTALVTILKEGVIEDPDEAYQAVKSRFDEEYGLVWLQPFGFNNTYTLTMRAEQAKALGIRTFSELSEHLRAGSDPELTAGFTAEFLDRADGYKGLVRAYDMQFASDPVQLDPGKMYQACHDGDVDVICGFATDGRIAAMGLKTLRDDKKFFPPYYAAPVIRKQTLRKYPQLRDVLNRLGGKIDDQTMQQLNYQVDRKDNARRAADVARDFLRREGLLRPGEPAGKDEGNTP
jgi:glycine betaine/choline ABC-type transport system substrate-binding protein